MIALADPPAAAVAAGAVSAGPAAGAVAVASAAAAVVVLPILPFAVRRLRIKLDQCKAKI